MIQKKTIKMTVLGVLFALVLGACGSSGKAVKNYTANTSLAGLTLDNSQAPTLLYVRSDAPGLDTYNTFIIDPIILDPRDESIKKLKKDDLTRIQTYFTESLTKELENSGYKITDNPSNETMRMSFILSGIKAPNASANVTSVLLPIALKVGGVTIEGVFKESKSDRIDAVVISRSQGSRVANSSPWSTWSDVESAMDKWAKGIAKAVDMAHGK